MVDLVNRVPYAGLIRGQAVHPNQVNTFTWTGSPQMTGGATGAGVFNVRDYGAYGDGVHDDTEAIADAAQQLLVAGGVLFFPPGTYMVNRGCPLPRGSWAQGCGPGNTTIKGLPGFPNTGDERYSFFYNDTWGAVNLAAGDSDIKVSGIAFDFYDNVHTDTFASLKMRYVTRLTIENNFFYYGSNAIAVRGCEQTLVDANSAIESFNCSWDFWEGPGTTTVTRNYAQSSDIRQFLNFNPEVSPIATSPLNVVAKRLIVANNEFRGTGASPEPIQIEPLSDIAPNPNRDNGVTDVVISGNQFHRTYIVHRGNTKRLTITGNTFDDYPDPNTSVIIIYPSTTYTPEAITISGNVIDDPHTDAANLGVIRCQSDIAVVTANIITGTYDAAPFYQGSNRPNHYGNYYEKLGITGRFRQGFVLTNHNGTTGENQASSYSMEDLSGALLRHYMQGNFEQKWSTTSTGSPRQVWSMEADNDVSMFTFLIGVVVAGLLRTGVGDALTATGSTQPGALALTANWNNVGTTALNTGVRLPAGTSVSQTGAQITIWNNGANPLNVYPPTSGAINALAVNTPDVLQPGSCRTYVATTTTQFRTTDNQFDTLRVLTSLVVSAGGTINLGGGYFEVDALGTAKTSGRLRGYRVVVAAGAITAGAQDEVIVVNKTVGAATTLNLPVGEPGREYVIKDGKGDAAANNITITPAAGTIDGAATLVINANYGRATVVYNGTEWNQIA